MITNEDLLSIVNYNPGGCLCGHFETCPVCTRSSATRKLEIDARAAALELLALRGIEIVQVEETFGWLHPQFRMIQ